MQTISHLPSHGSAMTHDENALKTTKRMLKGILADEQEHADELKDLLKT
ncbi:MAG: hypothetical protein KKG12_02090 [Gammaproteobacteria bacterium]|jgi:bacterioferritin (cytochrome b1)|nr:MULTISPECIES: hypothetical protein [unclassified Acidovorax]MBP3980100.1 hypothetical protein [Acidovorax sp. JG5]MBU4422555.1 hypothetical protein [Gammaproteobacteria bacterium]